MVQLYDVWYVGTTLEYFWYPKLMWLGVFQGKTLRVFIYTIVKNQVVVYFVGKDGEIVWTKVQTDKSRRVTPEWLFPVHPRSPDMYLSAWQFNTRVPHLSTPLAFTIVTAYYLLLLYLISHNPVLILICISPFSYLGLAQGKETSNPV